MVACIAAAIWRSSDRSFAIASPSDAGSIAPAAVSRRELFKEIITCRTASLFLRHPEWISVVDLTILDELTVPY
jgi:hypothetical protein